MGVLGQVLVAGGLLVHLFLRLLAGHVLVEQAVVGWVEPAVLGALGLLDDPAVSQVRGMVLKPDVEGLLFWVIEFLLYLFADLGLAEAGQQLVGAQVVGLEQDAPDLIVDVGLHLVLPEGVPDPIEGLCLLDYFVNRHIS